MRATDIAKSCGRRGIRTVLCTLGLLSGLSIAAHACNVPVFRFALERWRGDSYQAVLFHRGPLNENDRAIIAPWTEEPGESLVNVVCRAIDVDKLDEAGDRDLFESQQGVQFPWLVVRYPEHLHIETPIWAGPLSADAVARLTDSPVRQELVRRLTAGQTAVWLLLESGASEIDKAAAARLTEELPKLEQKLKLPELSDSPDDELHLATPLRVSFSLLTVPRNEAEQGLVEMLLHSESDLAERGEPLVFPVFGRGRALLPLVGAGITAENIHDSAAFLVGPCSCQVKAQNPGFDLLLQADWDNLLARGGVPLVAAAASAPPPDKAELVPIPSGAPSQPAVESGSTPVAGQAPAVAAVSGSTVWILGGVLLAGVLGIVGLLAAWRPSRVP